MVIGYVRDYAFICITYTTLEGFLATNGFNLQDQAAVNGTFHERILKKENISGETY